MGGGEVAMLFYSASLFIFRHSCLSFSFPLLTDGCARARARVYVCILSLYLLSLSPYPYPRQT